MIRVARFSGQLSFYEEEGRNRTMELLKQRIRKDGTVKGNDVLKVDSFLNHQMDVALFEEIGKEFDNRDHTTVMHSIDRIEKLTKQSPEIAEVIKDINANINARYE